MAASPLLRVRGQHVFARLLSLRPIAVSNHFALHAQTAGVPAGVQFGAAVPKRLVPLAVDRNRIKRALRAQTALLGPRGATVIVRMRKPLGYSAFSPNLSVEIAQLWHTARSHVSRAGAASPSGAPANPQT